MTVAIITHYLGPRLGIGQYLQRLVPALVEELKNCKREIKILGSPNAVQKTPALGELKDLVEILPPLDYSPGKRYFWFATQFSQYCHRTGIKTVVWLSNPIVLPWHPPSVAVIHDVNEWKAAKKYGDRLKTSLRAIIYLDASIHFAKKIIVVSKATERDLLYFRPDPKLKEKLRTIPNGADSPLIDLPPVSINAPKNPFLLSVGRIDPVAKRLPEAVALGSALREISGEDWELHLVGGMNETTKPAGEAFLASIEDLFWVHYHGHIEDPKLAQWYRQATAVVFLSDSEGFGFPIAEAASFGRLVVVNRINRAGIEAGGDAILPVAPEDPHDSASQLLLRLKQGKNIPISTSLPRWQSAALAYATEINEIIPQ